ncbi:MAG: biopolymer transporter ExbD [Hyphomicrobium sp.]
MGASVGGFGGYDDDGETSYKPVADINITPMVDVMLVLLIIFMVAAPLLVAGVPVELPKTSAARMGQSKKPMVVTLAADGRLQIRDELVTKDNLISRLAQVRAAEGDAVVYVRADKKIPYGDVMELLGQVGQGGFGRVSLLSQSVPKGPAPAAGMPSQGVTP